MLCKDKNDILQNIFFAHSLHELHDLFQINSFYHSFNTNDVSLCVFIKNKIYF